MVEIIGNLFDYLGFYPICITTNGYVNAKGKAIMGAGVAKQCANLFPGIEATLGQLIKENGNITQVIIEKPIIISLPTKPKMVAAREDKVLSYYHHAIQSRPNIKFLPGFMAKSDPEFIRQSIDDLVKLADNKQWERIVLPWPGIGMGGLPIYKVRNLLNILDDRFLVIKPPEKHQ